MNEDILLELKEITKSYSNVTVLNKVSMNIRKGEVHALLGANGAGKSTLVKIIAGAITPKAGEILFEGSKYEQMDPALADKLGIRIIYQERNLVPNLSVQENVFMGMKLGGSNLVNYKLLSEKTSEILKTFELDIKPTDLVKDLSAAYKQMVEIAKAMSSKIKLLILDEPTASLSAQEVRVLFELIRRLKNDGVSIIYISHRLEEIFEITDRITVLRDGKWITTIKTKDTNRKELISYMVNSDMDNEYPDREKKMTDEVVLEAKDICGRGFEHISFKVHKGEILGMAGLVGAGRTDVARAIFGADKLKSGEVFIEGKKADITSPAVAIKNGIAMLQEDRKTQGIAANLSIRWNMSMSALKSISKRMVIDTKKEDEMFNYYKDTFHIKIIDRELPIKTLSGGNQQKVIIGKWLAVKPKIIIFDEPTHGIDVGAKKEFYQLINDLADQGMAVLLISSETEELIGLTDRMVVMSEGKMSGELDREEFDKKRILDLSSGVN